jgi:hypothetical protein
VTRIVADGYLTVKEVGAKNVFDVENLKKVNFGLSYVLK